MEPELPGEPLGDFRIVREIGRGGMGTVYEAVQLSLGRRVALKVLPFAAALNARQLQRFKNEAHAAAQLHHTNIVPVYAVGAARGVHFYAMQLIEGQNLATLIEDLRRCEAPNPSPASQPPRSGAADQTGPFSPVPLRGASPEEGFGNSAADTRPNLGAQLSTQRSGRGRDFFRTAARLAAQAAEGLEYAHEGGVVHRDIKPANLLVDDRGTVWITDFGLAQFHTDVALTQTGDMLGTLRYMSPEQAGGQRHLIDHRTDIYSLGSTLYELLTLRPIFDGADQQTLLQQILHEEPRPPRAIDASIPPELETIVLKAAGKTPAERYATARDLADDLNRFLRDEPILARRATLVQRGRKWLRRHPSVLVAGAVLLLLLAMGSLVGAGFIRSAYERERQRADEAEESLRLARGAVDELIQVAEGELADRPGSEGLRKRLLDSALGYYRTFIRQRRDNPAAQAELLDTKERVEQILADLAVLRGAGLLDLLKQPAVVDDLRLSQSRRAKVKELSARLDEQRKEWFGTFVRLAPAERRRRDLEVARANEADVNAILTPEQLQRLRQIALQLQGPRAFREPDVAAELKLTADQRERIRAIDEEAFFAGRRDKRGPVQRPREPRKPAGPGDQSPKERILALLTAKQARQWQEMTGASFKGQTSFCPSFIPGRPGYLPGDRPHGGKSGPMGAGR